MSDLMLICENTEALCEEPCECNCDTCQAVRYISKLQSRLTLANETIERIKNPLRKAVLVVEYREGDISTEDGNFAVTDLDSIILLESALCSALDADSDNANMLDLGSKINNLATALEGIEVSNDADSNRL